MSKYQPLSDHLGGRNDGEWRASFAELEEVLGFPLPSKARTHNSWWANDADKAHNRCWLDAGWRTEEVDRQAGSVLFRRHVAAAPMQSEPPERPAESASRETQVKRAAGVAAIAGAAVAVVAGLGAVVARALRRR